MKTVQAWHFVGERLRDGRPLPRDGEWLIHEGPLVLCCSGLHASEHPFDALNYAPGPILCRVECAGVVRGTDKLACWQRRIIARMDATELLRYFARMQALSVIHLWPSDPPEVVLDYLMTGDEAIRDAARALAVALLDDAAARNAARAVARAASAADAAWCAAWAAARAAAAARNAARAAARAAAAARNAARAVARDDFAVLVYECFGLPKPRKTRRRAA